METARTRTAAIIGVEGHLVEVEADIAPGLPATILTGLPDTVLREARDRVRAAIVNSGESWPSAKITVGLYPAVLPKRSSAYDLAIAIAIMAANGDLPTPPEGTMFLAELGLDGRLRPVPGVLTPALAAADAEITTIVVATANQAEAGQVPGLTVIAADTLTEIADWLRGGPPRTGSHPAPVAATVLPHRSRNWTWQASSAVRRAAGTRGLRGRRAPPVTARPDAGGQDDAARTAATILPLADTLRVLMRRCTSCRAFPLRLQIVPGDLGGAGRGGR